MFYARSVSEVLRQKRCVICRVGIRSTFDRGVRRKPPALAEDAGNYGFSIMEMKLKG
jgi:hypothetical protein